MTTSEASAAGGTTGGTTREYRQQWIERLYKVFHDCKVVVHGSMYYGTDTDTSDIDIYLICPANVFGYINWTRKRLVGECLDQHFKFSTVTVTRSNREHTRILRCTVDNLDIDIAFMQPDGYNYLPYLKMTLDQEGVRDHYMQLVARAKEKQLISYRKLTKFRLLWIYYLWDYYRGHCDPVTDEALHKFVTTEMFGYSFNISINRTDPEVVYIDKKRKRRAIVAIRINGNLITAPMMYSEQVLEAIEQLFATNL